MKFGKREKMLAGGVGAVVTILLLQKFIVEPFLGRIKELDRAMAEQEKDLKEFLIMDSQRDGISEFYEKMKSFIQVGETEEEVFAVIIRTVEETAKSSEVALVKMKPETSEETGKEKYSIKKVTLSVEGAQRNIVNFLYKLEDSGYPLKIFKVDFKIKSRETHLMSADIEVHCMHFLK